jgi:hypothetical protein
VRFVLLSCLLLGLAACSSASQVDDVSWTPVSAPELGAVVARVGQVPIYASQVLAEAKRSAIPPRRALDDLVTTNLLAELARRDGFGPAPSSDPEVESVLVQRLLERELEPSLRPEAVPDQNLRTLYDRAKHGFVHPRLVEIGVLAVYTGQYMKGPLREQRTRTAMDLAAYLKGHPPRSLDDFIAVARDPAWSSRHVAYDRFLQSPDRPLSRKVGEEIVKLRAPGETTSLLEDDEGFYIARYLGERPPENITFEQVRAKLLAGYLSRWQQEQFVRFTDKLMQAHKIAAYFDRLPQNEQGP